MYSGTRPIDWVYIDNVVEAFLSAATRLEALGLVPGPCARNPPASARTSTAVLADDGTERRVPVEELVVGARFVVRPDAPWAGVERALCVVPGSGR